MYKCNIRETIYDLQVYVALYVYNGSALARGDVQYHCIDRLQCVLQKLETFACHNFLLLSYLHFTLVI
jgi:hypothetical protein